MSETLTKVLPVTWVVLLALIILIVVPMPLTPKQKLVSLISRLSVVLYGVMLLLCAVFAQEFNEQRKFAVRRSRAIEGVEGANLHYFAFECFKHQRDMYLVGVTLAMTAVLSVLVRIVNSFMAQHKDLMAQRESRARAE